VRSPPVKNEDLAINYDVAGAMDLLETFFKSGAKLDLSEALRRLSAVAEKLDARQRPLARSMILELMATVEGMPAGDRACLVAPPHNMVENTEEARRSRGERKWDLLVVAALHDPELSAFLRCLTDVRNNVGAAGGPLPGATYYTGSLPRHHLGHREPLSVAALFQSRPGMVDAATLVSNSILYFRPRLLAMTGVSAGRAKMGVKLNDLLVPGAVFTCDTGKHTETGFEKEPLWAEVDDSIIQRVHSAGGGIVESLVKRLGLGGSTFLGAPPTIHTHVMACGSTVINRSRMIDEIAGSHRKVVGLDMEAYGFLRAARLTDAGLKAFVVKGVMDLGSRKTDRQKERAAFWAANFLSAFVTSEFELLQLH
jgi:nucleoside phosphorylase